MVTAKEFHYLHIRKIQRAALYTKYDYCIFDMSMPFKFSDSNINSYQSHNNFKEIGLFLRNHKLLDKRENKILFSSRKAVSSPYTTHIILKLCKPDNINFQKWISSIQEHILKIQPSLIMLPIDNKKNIQSISDCNIIIQELNVILIPLAINSEVIIYQQCEPLSSLAYIIQNTVFPRKVSLCIDLDYIEKEFYTLRDIKEDILRFNIKNKISMIKTNKYSDKNAVFRDLLKVLPEDVIVFGDKI